MALAFVIERPSSTSFSRPCTGQLRLGGRERQRRKGNGGQVGVTSRSGEGSTFWFTLDLPRAAEFPDTEQMVTKAPTAAEQQAVAARVLLAEDNIVNQKVAARILERLGCRVDVATNGKDAVEMATRTSYDVIFMDWLMPEMDGFEATAKIRTLGGEKQRVRIIAMTALAMDGDSKRCLAAGMDDYISKPFKLQELQAALARWAQAAPGRRQEELDEPSPPSAPTGHASAGEHPSPPLDSESSSQPLESAPLGDDSSLDELFSSFLDNATATIELLRQAACAGNATGLTQAAHSLKDSSRSVGARPLAGICERLEALGSADALADASECIDELEQEFRRVKSTRAT